MDYESDNKGLEDFELLRSCHHQITCNSTYSWWAAWLNDTPEKLVIHPEKKGDVEGPIFGRAMDRHSVEVKNSESLVHKKTISSEPERIVFI